MVGIVNGLVQDLCKDKLGGFKIVAEGLGRLVPRLLNLNELIGDGGQ